jgi:hydroxymethylbilane synthase
VIVIGTRGSALALAQARIVAIALGGDVELRVISTAGDRSDRPIRELGDGVFVTAIEDALRGREIDIAVHSLKDLPTIESPDLAIAAVPAREDPRDVVITRGRDGWRRLRAGDRVGTASPRRDAFVRAVAPGIVCAEIRGNVDTRLRKVRDGEYDATVLAAAGLRRLGIDFAEEEALPIELCPPAPGPSARCSVWREPPARCRSGRTRAVGAVRSSSLPRSRATPASAGRELAAAHHAT